MKSTNARAGTSSSKAVQSQTLGGAVDAAMQVQAHRDRTPEDGPTTVGTNPHPPRRQLKSRQVAPLSSGTPFANSQATSFTPFGGD